MNIEYEYEEEVHLPCVWHKFQNEYIKMNMNLKINMNMNPNEQKVPLVRVWRKVQRLPLGRSHRRTQGSTCNHIKVKRAKLSIFFISSATLRYF